MASWWVTQGRDSFEVAQKERALYSILEDKRGRQSITRKAILDIRPGDLIISYHKGVLRAVSFAMSLPYRVPLPPAWKGKNSPYKNRYRVDLQYTLTTPIPFKDIREDLYPLLKDAASPPVGSDKRVGQSSYIHELPPKAAQLLLDRMGAECDSPIDQAIRNTTSDTVEREALVKSRVGQGPYRQRLLQYWKDRCAVTGVTEANLLEAGHIKPWRDSNNKEKLDFYNGLPLTPTLSKLFDKGYITFDEKGRLHMASTLDQATCTKLGLSRALRLSQKLNKKHLPYLRYHQRAIFQDPKVFKQS